MHSSNIVARAKNILISPGTEWPVAAAEPATTGSLYAGYIAIMAALPVLAHFIKFSLLGSSFLGNTMRVPIGAGIGQLLLGYSLSLALVYVMARIVNALAGTFDAQPDPVQALKVVAYSWTASWVAGIGVLVPWLSFPIMLAGGLYSIYLLYLGLPHTMKCPPEKAAGYTAVSMLIAIVLGWMVSMIVGLAFMGAMGGAHINGSHGDSVTLDSNNARGRLAITGQQAEQAGKQAVGSIDPGQLESVKNEGVQSNWPGRINQSSFRRKTAPAPARFSSISAQPASALGTEPSVVMRTCTSSLTFGT